MVAYVIDVTNHMVSMFLKQVVEFSAARCFKSFVDRVQEARRLGDADESQQLIGDLFKLIGKFAFCILRNILFCVCSASDVLLFRYKLRYHCMPMCLCFNVEMVILSD